ncbi:MAG: hypothetical protein WCA32_22880 [Chromatiaceae bacterium]
MTRDRNEVAEQSTEGDELDAPVRARVRWRNRGGLRKMHRERDESRDKAQKRRRDGEWR